MKKSFDLPALLSAIEDSPECLETVGVRRGRFGGKRRGRVRDKRDGNCTGDDSQERENTVKWKKELAHFRESVQIGINADTWSDDLSS